MPKMNRPKYVKVSIDLVSSRGASLKKAVQFISNGCMLFFNAQHLLMQLSNKDRAFFDYLCEIMGYADNDVYIDEPLKSAFIAWVEEITSFKIKITGHTVAKSVIKLKDLGLILATNDRARYTVNPKYVYKGSAHRREKYLKALIENRIASNLSITALLNVPEAEFLPVKVKEEK
jgi:hypothetical protein